MREIGSVRFRYFGDVAAAQARAGAARVLLGQLKAIMQLNGLQQLSRTITLEDGTQVICSSLFGQDEISIVTPGRRLAESQPFEQTVTFAEEEEPVSWGVTVGDSYPADPTAPGDLGGFNVSLFPFRSQQLGASNQIRVPYSLLPALWRTVGNARIVGKDQQTVMMLGSIFIFPPFGPAQRIKNEASYPTNLYFTSSFGTALTNNQTYDGTVSPALAGWSYDLTRVVFFAEKSNKAGCVDVADNGVHRRIDLAGPTSANTIFAEGHFGGLSRDCKYAWVHWDREDFETVIPFTLEIDTFTTYIGIIDLDTGAQTYHQIAQWVHTINTPGLDVYNGELVDPRPVTVAVSDSGEWWAIVRSHVDDPNVIPAVRDQTFRLFRNGVQIWSRVSTTASAVEGTGVIAETDGSTTFGFGGDYVMRGHLHASEDFQRFAAAVYVDVPSPDPGGLIIMLVANGNSVSEFTETANLAAEPRLQGYMHPTKDEAYFLRSEGTRMSVTAVVDGVKQPTHFDTEHTIPYNTGLFYFRDWDYTPAFRFWLFDTSSPFDYVRYEIRAQLDEANEYNIAQVDTATQAVVLQGTGLGACPAPFALYPQRSAE